MHPFRGMLLILTSAVGFGSMALFAHLAYADGVDTPTLLALRFLIATGILAVWVKAKGLRLPRGRTLVGYLIMGLVLYSGMAWTYFSALRHASSGLVALLLYVYPVIVASLSALLRIDRFGRVEWSALVVCSIGLAMLLGNALTGQPLGIALALAAALFYASYIVFGSRLGHDADPVAAALVVIACGAVFNTVIALIHGPALPASATGWLGIGGVAVFGTVVAVGTFFAGLRHTGPTLASVLSTLEPVVTVLLGVQFLDESFNWNTLAGAVLVLGATMGLAIMKGRQQVQSAVAVGSA